MLETPSVQLGPASFSKSVSVLFHFLELLRLVTAAARGNGGSRAGLTIGKGSGWVPPSLTLSHGFLTQFLWFTEPIQGVSFVLFLISIVIVCALYDVCAMCVCVYVAV